MNSRIFQHNTFTTLSSGFYKGTITLKEALKHGSVGIGTLDTANGEVTIINGIAYHGDSENHVRLVEEDETMPYVAMVEHQPIVKFTDNSVSNSEDFLSALIKRFPTGNTAYTIVMTGQFKEVTISSKPANNTRPYDEIMADQPYFTKENISGTMVGVWAPKHLTDLFGSGFHLHFVSDDKTFTAHVQNFITENLEIEIGKITKIDQEFPEDDENFDQHLFQ
ncbi:MULTISPECIES: acetolactate decarboxylase [Lactococcus]|uniref:acetolactate decarboxylase n=1 Tax=Lactococcus TaxID=1357 RepID=UPI001CDD4275|nr:MULTISPECIES: acetolactate decarboxylase [Lactococcus]MCA2388913.1 acetolactate decarboxylase [Lactococcus sp. NH2-7C]MCI1071253.1 acetolactate decarboxylase [Lactococcus lactis]MCT1182333.1 acetolactate decarboxylase [Lactococcus lactis]MCT1193357.1 acetolactate decarboxylase [Lactococcus lactis]WGV30468.1 acetolactate decarboxylase [Lactococcus sp. NH2-7C]